MTTHYAVHPSDGHVFTTANPELWKECKFLGTAAGKRAMRDQAMARLREILPSDGTVYAIVRHVSRSGMRRVIDFYIIGSDAKLQNITHYMRDVLGWKYTNDAMRGLVIDGCGMDMAFHAVHRLSTAMGWTVKDKGLGTLRSEIL